MKRWGRSGLGMIAAGLGLMLGVAPAFGEPLVVPESGPVAGGTSVALPPLPEATVSFTSMTGGTSATVFALGTDGKTYGWGAGWNGQLGNGSTGVSARTPTPVTLPPGVTFLTVSGGGNWAAALGSDGNTYAWGENTGGKLGNGTTEDSLIPTQVSVPDGVTFTSLSVSNSHALALGSDGQAYAWGNNGWGELGNGTTEDSNVPTLVNLPEGVTFTSVSAGHISSQAIGSDGKNYAWGVNTSGQTGNGTTEESHVPTLVSVPDGVRFTSISAGQGQTLALTDSGEVYAWGGNYYGQIGDGTRTNARVPTLVNAPDGVTFTAVAAGQLHSLALGSDGKAYGWGSNKYGQSAGTSEIYVLVPKPMRMPPGVTYDALFGSYLSTHVLGSDGNAYSLGDNDAGQLGDGSTTNSRSPRAVVMPKATAELTQVLFGGVPATDAVVNEDGTITATTPENGVCGPIDVTVEWTAGGVVREPVVYEGGFTYEGEYALTGPADQAVKVGSEAEFTTGWSVCDGGVPVWEVSLDGGKTWVDASTLSGVTVAEGGLRVTVATTAEHKGRWFVRPVVTGMTLRW